MKLTEVIREKVVSPLAKLLKQGLTPFKLSLVIALGLTLSVFPVFGTTTLLCTLIAMVFRLNMVAIQVANYIAFPVQIILFSPFLDIGEKVTGKSLEGISESTFLLAFDTDYFQAISELSNYLVLAIIGWVFAAMPIFITTFYCSKLFISKYIGTYKVGNDMS
tara:strand:- start:1984 stop:2472 length:489 start_codon:yes stop_codon:yes gene_type:complete